MNSEADFIAALAASPGDELLYQAFGDWLEEQGDARADCVRSALVRPWMVPDFTTPVPRLIAALQTGKDRYGVRRAIAAVGAPMVPELVKLLQHKSASVRELSIQCLRKMKKVAAEAVPALVEALKDDAPMVREQAARAIRECGAKKVTDTASIRESLSDSNWSVRREAAGILATMGAKGVALEQLVAQLDDANHTVRMNAVAGLGNLKSKDAVTPLCRMLGDKAPTVRVAAAGFLAQQVGRDAIDAVEPLRTALADPDLHVRSYAATALGNIGTGALIAVGNLLELAKRRNESSTVREPAIVALGQIAAGDDEVLEVIEQLMADQELAVAFVAAGVLEKWPVLPERIGEAFLALARRAAGRTDFWSFNITLSALGKLQRVTPAALEVLREAVRLDGPVEYREGIGPFTAVMRLGTQASSLIPGLVDAVYAGNRQAAAALGCMGSAGVDRLIGLLDEPHRGIQQVAVLGLAKAKREALPAIGRLLAFFAQQGTNPDEELLSAICHTIWDIGPQATEAIPVLLQQLDTPWSHGARMALSGFGSAILPHVPLLVSLLRDERRYHLHPIVAEVFLFLHPTPRELVEPLREVLRAGAVPLGTKGQRAEYAQKTRELAARALYCFSMTKGHREAARAAVPDLLPLLKDPFENVRSTAINALGEIRAAEAIPGLCDALRDEIEKVRSLAAMALGKIGEASAAADLALALRDRSGRVRREAATALGKVRAGDDRTLAALRQAEKDPDAGVRREATEALRKAEAKRGK